MRAEAPVSVVIPVYNSGRLIAEALRSVSAQTSPPAEIIVADDGSTDDTVSVVLTFERVDLLRLPHQGAAEARNAGARRASKDYLAFLDADDLWPASRLERQVAALQENPDLDFVAGSMVSFRTGDGGAVERVSEPVPSRLPSVLLIRREAFWKVGAFSARWEVGETIEWWSRAVDAGLRGMTLPDTVLLRREHAANLGRTAQAPFRSYLHMLHSVVSRRRASDQT